MRIFISYSRADRRFARQLAPLLRRVYGYDKVFYDYDLHGGELWWQEILRQIGICDVFIYLLSNDSLTSQYCRAEYREAKRLQKLMLPVRVQAKISMPPELAELNRIQHEDMSKGPTDGLALNDLHASINRLSNMIPSDPLPPLTLEPEPMPVMPSPGRKRRIRYAVAAIMAAVVIVVCALYIGRSIIFPPPPEKPTGTNVSPTMQPLEGHTDSISDAAWSPDGMLLGSASADDTMIVWDVGKGERRSVFTSSSGSMTAVAWARTGTELLTGSQYGTLVLWDVTTSKRLQELDKVSPDHVADAAWSPDGRWLATVQGGATTVWTADLNTQPRTLQGGQGDWWPKYGVAWSPDSMQIAVASAEDTVSTWNVWSGQHLDTLTGHHDDVTCVAWSPDGAWLASGSLDNNVIVWDVEAGIGRYVLRGHEGSVNSVAWSPDGTMLASASSDGTVRTWQVSDGTPLGTLDVSDEAVNVVAWSPDGARLATGAADGTVGLWAVPLAP